MDADKIFATIKDNVTNEALFSEMVRRINGLKSGVPRYLVKASNRPKRQKAKRRGPSGYKRFEPGEREKIIKMAQTHDLRKVAKTFGRTYQSVYNVLWKHKKEQKDWLISNYFRHTGAGRLRLRTALITKAARPTSFPTRNIWRKLP